MLWPPQMAAETFPTLGRQAAICVVRQTLRICTTISPHPYQCACECDIPLSWGKLMSGACREREREKEEGEEGEAEEEKEEEED